MLAGRNGPPDPPVSGERSPPPPARSAEAVIDHQQYVEDTFVNKTALNPETYAETFKLLQRYSAGSRIAISYSIIHLSIFHTRNNKLRRRQSNLII